MEVKPFNIIRKCGMWLCGPAGAFIAVHTQTAGCRLRQQTGCLLAPWRSATSSGKLLRQLATSLQFAAVSFDEQSIVA